MPIKFAEGAFSLDKLQAQLALDGALAAVLVIIFCFSFLSTMANRETAPESQDSMKAPASPVMQATAIVAPPTVAAKAPAVLPAPPIGPPPAAPSKDAAAPSEGATSAIRCAVERVLNALPDDAAAPMHCNPKRVADGVLPPKVARDVLALRAAIEQRLDGYSAAVRAEAEAQLDDLTLARWVIASPGASAADPFEKAMEWRAATGVGKLFAELHPLARTSGDASARQVAVQSHFYGGVGGLAKDGTPFIVERLGKADFAGWGKQAAVGPLMKEAYIAHLETLTRVVRAVAAASERFVMAIIIIDAKGLGASILFHLAFVKFAAKVGLSNFPEGTDRVFVVNAPTVVARVFGGISPLLPEATRDKVQILSESQTRAALASEIDPAELPTFLGGDQPESAMLHMPKALPLPRSPIVGL